MPGLLQRRAGRKIGGIFLFLLSVNEIKRDFDPGTADPMQRLKCALFKRKLLSITDDSNHRGTGKIQSELQSTDGKHLYLFHHLANFLCLG